MNLSTFARTFSSTPHRCLIDLSASYKVILVCLSSFNPSCLATNKCINDTLAPRSQNVYENSTLPIVQGIEKLPGSFNFSRSLF